MGSLKETIIFGHPDGYHYLIKTNSSSIVSSERVFGILPNFLRISDHKVYPSPNRDYVIILSKLEDGGTRMNLIDFRNPINPSSWKILHSEEHDNVNDLEWKSNNTIIYYITLDETDDIADSLAGSMSFVPENN